MHDELYDDSVMCARIAVDELIEALHEHHWQNRLIIDFWKEVKHESLENIYDRVENEISSWDWYDQKLFRIYKDERKPMRQISEETGISLKSIFLTIKSCKERIRQSVGDDYTDFLNEEFELI